jgi:hypothetical protein
MRRSIQLFERLYGGDGVEWWANVLTLCFACAPLSSSLVFEEARFRSVEVD